MTSRILGRAVRIGTPKVGTNEGKDQHAVFNPTAKSALRIGVDLHNPSSFPLQIVAMCIAMVSTWTLRRRRTWTAGLK